MIEKMQTALKALRNIAGLTTAELGECIGTTKQTISNLEIGKAKMKKHQYIAIRVVFEKLAEENNQLKLAKEVLLGDKYEGIDFLKELNKGL